MLETPLQVNSESQCNDDWAQMQRGCLLAPPARPRGQARPLLHFCCVLVGLSGRGQSSAFAQSPHRLVLRLPHGGAPTCPSQHLLHPPPPGSLPVFWPWLFPAPPWALPLPPLPHQSPSFTSAPNFSPSAWGPPRVSSLGQPHCPPAARG